MSDISFDPKPLDAQAKGCPSGLAPASASDGADIAPFVQSSGRGKRLQLIVRGAKCGGCLSKIEASVSALDGVNEARLNLSTGHMSVRWEGELGAQTIVQTLDALGYAATPFDDSEEDTTAKAEEKSLLMAMGVAGFAAANIMLLSVSVWSGHAEMSEGTRQLLHAVSALIAIPAIAFAGRPFFASAWNVLRKGKANMDVPVSLAVCLALGVSLWETAIGGEHAYFDACVMLLFFLLIGRFLDARLRRRAHAAAHDLAALQNRTATRIDANGTAKTVRASQINPGDTIMVAAGERASVDFDVIRGTTEIDEALVTGESLPRQVSAGARVFAGSVIVGAAITGQAVAAASDSLLADITRMLEAGEQRRSAYRRIADRAVALYVPVVHSVAALTFLGWLASGASVREAVLVAVSTLIITCPCALALAAPVAQVVAAGRLYRAGVFLRSGDALERLADVDHVVFDKTGTLTLGTPVLHSVGIDPDVLRAAASLARASRHPLSRSLVEAAGPGTVAEQVTEHAGLGLEGIIDGKACRLGSAEWVEVSGKTHPAKTAPELWYSRGDDAPVRFTFEDHIHEDARQVVQGLLAAGIGVEVVSGDIEAAVAKVCAELGLTQWKSQSSPQEKVARLEALRDAGHKVLMVGDGLNDAGALALAHASLAPGGAMDVSQSASDAVYAGKGIAAVPVVMDTAKRAKSTMVQNFSLAAGYNFIAVPIAVLGFATPLVAAIAMSASSLIVTLNALRQNI